MNRRELAKNGFVGLCGALMGKKAKEPEPVGVPTTLWRTCTLGTEGNWVKSYNFLAVSGEDGYSLSDGTEIEHGIN